MKAAVILSGSGVYDGSEIHESVLTLLALEEEGFSYQCFAPDIKQHHVIDHTNGQEMTQERNVLQEAARIARGNILALEKLQTSEFQALILPGGFGAAKNLSKWAFDGPKAAIEPETNRLLLEFIAAEKPILAMCISPVLLAIALKDKALAPVLTVGTTSENSPYDIAAIHDGMKAIGAEATMVSVDDYAYDDKNKIICTPCYMQDTSIRKVRAGILKSIQKLKSIIM